eukprot:Pgem_evm1s13403
MDSINNAKHNNNNSTNSKSDNDNDNTHNNSNNINGNTHNTHITHNTHNTRNDDFSNNVENQRAYVENEYLELYEKEKNESNNIIETDYQIEIAGTCNNNTENDNNNKNIIINDDSNNNNNSNNCTDNFYLHNYTNQVNTMRNTEKDDKEFAYTNHKFTSIIQTNNTQLQEIQSTTHNSHNYNATEPNRPDMRQTKQPTKKGYHSHDGSVLKQNIIQEQTREQFGGQRRRGSRPLPEVPYPSILYSRSGSLHPHPHTHTQLKHSASTVTTIRPLPSIPVGLVNSVSAEELSRFSPAIHCKTHDIQIKNINCHTSKNV